MYSNKYIYKVAFPIFLSLFAQNIINVIDTAFLGRYGEIELGASAIGGIFYLAIFMLGFGFSTGSQILIARRNGERKYGEIGQIMLQGVLFLLVIAVLLFAFTRISSSSLLRLMVSSEHVYRAALEFLNYRIYGFFFSFVNVMFRAFYVGITKTKVLTINALLMMLVNVILDYLLIFGNFGCPRLGIAGAAIASVCAEAASVLFFIVYTVCFINIRKYGFLQKFSLKFTVIQKILSISIYTMAQSFVSISTWFLFFVAVEHLGEQALAVSNIIRSFYMFLFMPVSALAITANSLVSNLIGEGKKEQVFSLIKRILKLAFMVIVPLIILICLTPRIMLSIYTDNAALIDASVSSLLVISGCFLICAAGSVFFSSVSGTGNTRAALLIEIFALSFYLLFMYVIIYRLQMPLFICWIIELVYWGLILIASSVYLKKGTWKKKII
ncbi:MAG: MATE family efflux transporter [Candidatus Azobacteroides sp.]|nr:MATE family efflux transporter [Candidatus Azobacteroides sp.]